MIRAFSVPAVREAEAAAMADLEEGTLMQRAADALAEVVLARCRERPVLSTPPSPVVILVGPGDNGGDALYAAARLSGHLPVVVVQVGDVVHEGGAAAVTAAGVPRLRVARSERELTGAVHEALAGADVVVDGLLGIGGRPGLTGAMAGLAEAIPESALVIAVDLPSGADPAGEAPLAEHVGADETVTFGMAKPVHLLPATAPAVGRVTVVDIGVAEPADAVVEQLTEADVPASWPVPRAADDKYSRGVLGVVAGSARYPGAAVLAVTAALETGVGMVRYVGPDRATEQVLAACPEAVPGEGHVQAWVIGPGVSTDVTTRDATPDDATPDDGTPVDATPDDATPGDATPDVRHQVDACRRALASDLPVLVDAGALDLLEEPRGAPTLLTPHAGELARLLSRLDHHDVDRRQVAAAPLSHARRVAELTGATVLLKGATTLIVSPDADRPVRVQSDGPPWLATAGAGDVLAGLTGALLAAGMDALTAGSLGALVHGRAAHDANPGGPLRSLAVARALPRTVARILTSSPG